MDLSQRFKECKVIIVGDVMLDRYWWGTVDRISPEAPVPVIKLERISHAVGGAANVAANVKGLGAEALLIGTIGKDTEAQVLLEELNSLGIESNYLTKTDRPTSAKTRIVAHSQHVVRVDREEVLAIDDGSARFVNKSIEEAVAKAHIVILSDYAKGMLTDDVIEKTMAAAGRRGIPVLVDPKGKDFSKYKGASIITPNRREALEACRFQDDEPDIVDKAGNHLITDLGLDAVVITEGEKGMTLFERDKDPIALKAAAREIYDVTGAGDTVIACLAVAVAAGLPCFEAVNLANLAAGLVVEQVGTTAISIDLLTKKLENLVSDRTMSDAAQL
jgi:D-beta-D-heptose 7-phosphate kinase/D-beta-D-heptose 1-phosphate adenosyltransferase